MIFISVSASKESAFWSAISSSGVVYSITQACSVGNLDHCGCDKTKMNSKKGQKGWKWGGCSADIRHGLTLGRKFLDAREIEETARSLMNMHNNKAGRKVCIAILICLLVVCFSSQWYLLSLSHCLASAKHF